MKTLLKKTTLLAITIATVYSCCCPTDPTPSGTISEAEAQAMSDLYELNQYFYINENMGGQDNLSVNFDIEDLEDYICLVKKEAGSQGIGTPGVRVYFAATDDDPNSDDPSDIRMTVFFVGTSVTENSICDITGIPLLNMGDVGNNGFGTVNCFED